MGKSASLAALTMTDTSASEVGLTEKIWSKQHTSTSRGKLKAIIFCAEIIKCWSDSKLAILFMATFHFVKILCILLLVPMTAGSSEHAAFITSRRLSYS